MDHFLAIWSLFEQLGYNVVLANPETKHPATGWRGLANPFARRVTIEDLEKAAWVSDYLGFLFPASARDRDTPPLVVVDVDDLDHEATVRDLFGSTPLQVKTRRGVHYYYQAPDHTTKVISRNWILGEKSFDVKSWGAGVMCPGFDPYIPNVPLKKWDLEFLHTLPVFSLERYHEVWEEYRPKAREAARRKAKANPLAYPYVADKPTASGHLERMGDVAGDTVVTLPNGKRCRIDEVPAGSKIFAFDREDHNPSGQVWERDGVRWYTDHTMGMLWRVVSKGELLWIRKRKKPVVQESIERQTLPSGGYLDISPARGLTLIRSPHGTGKTHWAAQRFEQHESAVTIANTSSLAEFNAARFRVSCYRENEKRVPKVSTTINSLIKFPGHASLVHVDEADQVLSYLHSGTMDAPAQNLHQLLDLLAHAEEALITSADLSDDVISFFVRAYQRRTNKPFRVIEKLPVPGKRTIRIVPFARAKQLWHEHTHKNTDCAVLGFTNRANTSIAGWGYGLHYPQRKSLWISADNSRYDLTLDRLRSGLISESDFLFFSPAIQSGVSIEDRVSKVFLIHDKRDFDVETCCQMLMRFRNVKDTEVVYGIQKFGTRHTRWDDDHLDLICLELADATDRFLVETKPEYANGRPRDPEFAETWRIAQRRARQSFADPLGRLVSVAQSHGWNVEIDETEGNGKAFSEVLKPARDAREREVMLTILDAETISPGEATIMRKAAKQTLDEPQKLLKREILDFYGVDHVTPNLIETDRLGKYRKVCKEYARVWLYVHDRETLAWFEWKATKGRRIQEYRNLALRAEFLSELCASIFNDPAPEKSYAKRRSHVDAAAAIFNRETWAQAFGGKSAGVSTDAWEWAEKQLRRIGCKKIDTQKVGDDRVCVYSFEDVFTFSRAYREKLKQDYLRESVTQRCRDQLKRF